MLCETPAGITTTSPRSTRTRSPPRPKISISIQPAATPRHSCVVEWKCGYS